MLSFDEARLETRSLARNEYLFRQGDKVQAIYFIEDGRLRLDRRTFDGRSLVFGTSSAGEFFVEAALFADIFHCDAVATEPSRVRIYPKAAVLEALNTDPSSALPFLRLMAHQVIEARQRLVSSDQIHIAQSSGNGRGRGRSGGNRRWREHRDLAGW